MAKVSARPTITLAVNRTLSRRAARMLGYVLRHGPRAGEGSVQQLVVAISKGDVAMARVDDLSAKELKAFAERLNEIGNAMLSEEEATAVIIIRMARALEEASIMRALAQNISA